VLLIFENMLLEIIWAYSEEACIRPLKGEKVP